MRGTNHDLGTLRWYGCFATFLLHVSLVLLLVLSVFLLIFRMVVVPVMPVIFISECRIRNTQLIEKVGDRAIQLRRKFRHIGVPQLRPIHWAEIHYERLIACLGPEFQLVRNECDLPFAVYPNSGEEWDRVGRRWTGAQEEASLTASVPALVEAGARLVGGCCRVTPRDIAAIAAQLQRS